jgi:hypothetical protein
MQNSLISYCGPGLWSAGHFSARSWSSGDHSPAGITFTHYKGNKGTTTILEEAGPGVCVADFDGDGLIDIYFVNGRDLYGRGIAARNALYHNNGDGTFKDVTEKAGVPGTGYGLGCVWGDYDNDGHPDLYVTQYGERPHRNRGDGSFEDATERAGVGGMEYSAAFHTGATFFDYDRDGRLDLYVGSYVHFTSESRRTCTLGAGVATSCPPYCSANERAFSANTRVGTFVNARDEKVISRTGRTLWGGDYDNDGWP